MILGDLISGPIAPIYGPEVIDVDLRRLRGQSLRFSHTRYWSMQVAAAPPHVAVLRDALDLQAKGSFENTDVINSEKLVLLRHAPRAGIAPGGGVVLAVDGCVYGTAVTPQAQTPRHVAAGHLVTARNGNPAEVNGAVARR